MGATEIVSITGTGIAITLVTGTAYSATNVQNLLTTATNAKYCLHKLKPKWQTK